ncbi:MAG: peptidyl-prolyl cis-trans isomerase [Nitrospirota bacterium]|nr:peptidyl-prolyl cis-trans isomerase [Nitrospirota bacterium]
MHMTFPRPAHWLPLVFLLLLTAPAVGRATVIDRIAAVVGNQAITLSELDEMWGQVQQDPQLAMLLPDREALLSHLIDQRLQLQRARELGVAATPEAVEGALREIMHNNGLTKLSDLEAALAAEGKELKAFRREIQDQMTLGRVTQREVRARVQLSDAEVRQFYDAHTDAFSPPPTMRLRQIQVIFAGLSADDREAARLQMETLSREITGTDAFLAAEERLAGTPGISAGEIGTFSLGDLRPELAAAVHRLEAGQVSELVSLPAGIALFLAQEVSRNPPAPFEAIADTVRELGTREAVARRTDEWMAGLRREAHIVIQPLDSQVEAVPVSVTP